MKPAVLAAPAASAGHDDHAPIVAAPSFAADFCELIKARLTTLVLVTSLAGFYLGWDGPMDYALLGNALLGTAMVAAGAAALNQLIERRFDAEMHRTRERPLPAGRMHPDTALVIGFTLSVGGLAYLALLVNQLSALLAAVTLASYVFVYTPLKRRTTLNTIVGAVPGALPPVIGWAAARGDVSLPAWALFAILFFWQMPHFLAIAWLYREDYARAGFVMLPGADETGASTGQQAVSYSMGLLLVSLLPTLLGLTSTAFFAGAFVLGAGMIYYAVRLQFDPSRPRARALFFASIIYLPLLLGLMAACKLTP